MQSYIAFWWKTPTWERMPYDQKCVGNKKNLHVCCTTKDKISFNHVSMKLRQENLMTSEKISFVNFNDWVKTYVPRETELKILPLSLSRIFGNDALSLMVQQSKTLKDVPIQVLNTLRFLFQMYSRNSKLVLILATRSFYAICKYFILN